MYGPGYAVDCTHLTVVRSAGVWRLAVWRFATRDRHNLAKRKTENRRLTVPRRNKFKLTNEVSPMAECSILHRP